MSIKKSRSLFPGVFTGDLLIVYVVQTRGRRRGRLWFVTWESAAHITALYQHFPGQTEDSHEKFNECNWPYGRETNPGPLDDETYVLTTRYLCWVASIVKASRNANEDNLVLNLVA